MHPAVPEPSSNYLLIFGKIVGAATGRRFDSRVPTTYQRVMHVNNPPLFGTQPGREKFSCGALRSNVLWRSHQNDRHVIRLLWLLGFAMAINGSTRTNG